MLEDLVFPSLSVDNNLLLEANFSLEEIEVVVKASDGTKCPGPDGFNFAFIKEFWGLLKFDFRIFFDQFHANESIPLCLMSYFLTLVPKVIRLNAWEISVLSPFLGVFISFLPRCWPHALLRLLEI
jgi:hypothetical protein